MADCENMYLNKRVLIFNKDLHLCSIKGQVTENKGGKVVCFYY
ncbi:hypothetical protein GCM10011351_32170 [Paraliobacillus quinghaiensis]|uniref:Uncharacterized protein n=1 Tax=Paraliobacillus quinghaiensis TaxID=470815 RepID=A0A917TYJ0_9BACI|nr:hypothetical protein GCM10011351_32170 [Paraliobacillus quinghaiensis]